MIDTRITRRATLTSLAILPVFQLQACQAQAPKDAAEAIEAVVRETKNFSGNILVTRNGTALYRESFGMADRQTQKANTPLSRFATASLSKPLTAVLIFQMIEEGKLDLTRQLDAIFPALAGKPVAEITVDQLLSHTSGIEEVTERHLDRPLTPGDLETASLMAKSGTFSYSSAGYVVLKLIIEKVSTQNYSARLTEKIFSPAGMVDSGLMRQNATVPSLSLGYDGDVPVTLTYPIDILDGAGTLYTTSDDLARFDQALTNHSLLSADSQKLMYQRHTPEGGSAWGYGWALADQGGKLYPWHKGDLGGYTAVLARQIHRNEMVAILSNQGKVDLTPLRQKIMRILKASAV